MCLGLGDLKIHDISFLPDPCPLPEQIKKRALIDQEKLIYAPFSGVGGIVYDKDAVYVELGGSHSHNRKETDETDDIVTNLIETKETLDMKMEHSELQLFSGGKKLTARDFDSESDDEGSDVEQTQLYERNGKKEQSDLEAELEALRKKDFSKYKEEKVANSGRIRRKVIFDVSDEEIEQLNGSDDDEEESEYTTLKTNKNDEIHSKIKDVLQNLENRSSFEPADLSGSDDDSTDDDEKQENEDSSDSEVEDMGVRWKENLAKKAEDAFLERQSSTKNLMKLVYGKYESKFQREAEEEEKKKDENEKEEEDIGGLFKVVSHEERRKKMEKDSLDLVESSLYTPWNVSVKDWLDPENKILIQNCFVTGKWKDSEDAAELLKLDDAPDLSDTDSEIFGDFEDLETGEKHVAPKKRKLDEVEKDDDTTRKELAEKKKKLKEKFDAEYDNGGEHNFYDELKTNAEKQAELNKSEFENMEDDVRVQIEGYRPGMYVRIEFEKVPAEFVINFDPTYPLLIGSLNMGEENVGYVNVRMKKHRWYKRILKAGDPLIISLGWRRFQTIPLFSKLEDDLKFRYLKYTPEHLACNAHFWGPITPQGTGFIALQSCDSNPEVRQTNFESVFEYFFGLNFRC